MARIIMQCDERTQEFVLEEELSFGRSSQNTVRVPEANASRKHARILRENGQYVLEDLDSSNGTYVNGKKIEKHVLRDRDVFRIGKTEFTFTDAEDDPLVGAMLRGYQIRRRLGQGGMGSVYLGWQSSMERNVAIKVLRQDFTTDAEFVSRFESEAKLAGRLNHRNIIAVHDFGRVDDLYFFSMEYVDGENLQNLVDREGALDPDRCLQITRQMAEGLAHAHALGVLHQDIKPLNIMLTADGTVKIADLGLARTLHYGQEQDTQKGRLIGTPQYMAPEVLRRETPDVRSDIYAIGATLFHIASGRPAFLGGKSSEIVRQRLDSPTPDPQRYNPKLPRPMALFILRLMARDPSERPQTADDVVAEIDRLLQEIAVGPKPAPSAPPPLPAGSAPAPAPAPVPAPAPEPAPDAEPSSRQSGRYRSSVSPSKRLQAKIILYLASVLLAALLVIGVYALTHSDSAQAHRHFDAARAALDAGDLESALRQFDIILSQYPGTRAAEEARPLRDLTAIRAELAEVRQKFQYGGLSATEAGDRLYQLYLRTPRTERQLLDQIDALRGEISGQSVPATPGADTPAPGETRPPAAASLDQWRNTSEQVDSLVQRGNITDAVQSLAQFIDRKPATDETRRRAEERLAQLKREQEETAAQTRFAEGLAAAQALQAQGDSAGAWTKLGALLDLKPSEEDRERLRAALEAIDAPLRRDALALRRSAWRHFADLDPARVREETAAAARRFQGLPWEQAIQDIQGEAEWVHDLQLALVRSVERRLNEGYKTAVPGFAGDCGLTPRSEGGLSVIPPEGPAVPVAWSALREETIWDLAPPDRLERRARLGAALHFAGRGHFGYARSCLDGLPAESDVVRCGALIAAARGGRTVADRLDFANYLQIMRWSLQRGSWRANEELLRPEGADGAAAVLRDRLWRTANLAVRADLECGPGAGAVRLALDGGPAGRWVAEIRPDRTKLLFVKGTDAPTQSDGAALADGRLQWNITGGRATLESGGQQLCRIDAPASGAFVSFLSVDFDAVAGSLDNLVIEEGDAAAALTAGE